MLKKSKLFLLFLVVVLVLSCVCLASSCSPSENVADNETPGQNGAVDETPETRMVEDGNGNEVEIPYTVERVVPQIGAMAQITSLLGSAGKIVAAATNNIDDYFKQVFPEYSESNPNDLDSGNVEDVLASGAQVYYGPIKDEATIAQYEAAGIAVVPLNNLSTVEDIKGNITKIAAILGGDAPAIAESFNAYYQGNIDKVSQKTADIPEAERVRIMSLTYRGGTPSTINASDICSNYITAAGGINVAADLEQGAAIGAENIIAWNPDIIITMDAESKDTIMAESALQNVTAVKNNEVYVIPKGIYYWNVRSAEGAMMPLWLAKVMYPDMFTDIDLNEVVRDYFKTYYYDDVTDDEINNILKVTAQPRTL